MLCIIRIYIYVYIYICIMYVHFECVCIYIIYIYTHGICPPVYGMKYGIWIIDLLSGMHIQIWAMEKSVKNISIDW